MRGGSKVAVWVEGFDIGRVGLLFFLGVAVGGG